MSNRPEYVYEVFPAPDLCKHGVMVVSVKGKIGVNANAPDANKIACCGMNNYLYGWVEDELLRLKDRMDFDTIEGLDTYSRELSVIIGHMRHAVRIAEKKSSNS